MADEQYRRKAKGHIQYEELLELVYQVALNVQNENTSHANGYREALSHLKARLERRMSTESNQVAKTKRPYNGGTKRGTTSSGAPS